MNQKEREIFEKARIERVKYILPRMGAIILNLR